MQCAYFQKVSYLLTPTWKWFVAVSWITLCCPWTSSKQSDLYDSNPVPKTKLHKSTCWLASYIPRPWLLLLLLSIRKNDVHFSHPTNDSLYCSSAPYSFSPGKTTYCSALVEHLKQAEAFRRYASSLLDESLGILQHAQASSIISQSV